MDGNVRKESGNEEATSDHSLLLKPIDIRSSTVHGIISIVCNGTPEVRDLLLNECEMILECRMCRSLHRSLANFIAHKRVFCKEHCCESMKLFEQADIEAETVIVIPESPDSGAVNDDDPGAELFQPAGCDGSLNEESIEIGNSKEKIYTPAAKDSSEQTRYTPSLDNDTGDKMLETNLPSSAASKLYSVVAKHLKNRDTHHAETKVKLTNIVSNSNAVYQTVGDPSDKNQASKNGGTKSHTVLQDDNKIPSAPRVTEVKIESSTSCLSADCNQKSIACFKCGTGFISIKSLTIHMKRVHGKIRGYFNCMYCKASFRDLWSDTRHMLRVHQKSKTQMGRIRNRIRQRALQNVLDDHDSSEELDCKNEVVTSQALLPTVQLPKSVGTLKCEHCDKIFTKRVSLESHEKGCTRGENKVAPPKERQLAVNGRPKRTVKKKENSDFVASSTIGNLRGSTYNQISLLTAMQKKIRSAINPKTLSCMRCHQKFCNLSNARRHAAKHFGWNRFKCKLCGYQAYSRYSIYSHVQRIHEKQRTRHDETDSSSKSARDSSEEKRVLDSIEEIPEPDLRMHSSAEHSKSQVPPVLMPMSNCVSEPKSPPLTRQSQAAKKTTAESKESHNSKTKSATTDAAGCRTSPPSSTGFNISTRRHPRYFDTSPYRRPEHPMTLVTRSGAYLKTELFKSAEKKSTSSRRKVSTINSEQGNGETSMQTHDTGNSLNEWEVILD